MPDSTRTAPLVLAGVGLLVVGVLLGRMTAPTTTPAAPAPDDGQATAASGPGPSRVENGVPVGYAHSRAGAVAAAANLAVTLDGPDVLDPQRRARVLDVVAATDAQLELTRRFEDVASLLAERLSLDTQELAGSDVVMRTVPAGYRVAEYSSDSATVAVWGQSIFLAPGRQAVPSGWGTSTLTLTWQEGDWRVVDIETRDGPTPPVLGANVQVTEVASRVDGFEPFRMVPAEEG